MKKWLMVFLLAAIATTAAAKPWWMRGVDTNETDFLPPDVAFRVTASVEGTLIKVRWVIADGYYLYRDRISIKGESPDLIVEPPMLPSGTVKVDPYFGSQQIFTQQVIATAAYTRSDAGAHPMQIKVTYQGCAEAGLCYPPISKVLFAEHAAQASTPAPHPWERAAILAGVFAFLGAGLALRKGRNLDLPAA